MEAEPMQDKPEDLSMKSSSSNSNSPPSMGYSRRVKPIPPPLDLNARTLDEPSDLRVPKSPGDLPRECLPIRKRPLLEVRRDLHGGKSPRSAGPIDISPAFVHFRNVNTAPSSPLSSGPPRLPYPSSTLSLTPSSGGSLASSNSAFSHFPVPPIMKAHGALPKSPFLQTGHGNGYPTPPTDLPSPFAWATHHAHFAQNMFSPFSPLLPLAPLPFPTTALLSPAPSSYPSSTNSSREDLPHGGGSGIGTSMESESKRRYLSTTSSNTQVTADSTSPIPSSPLHSPRTWSHSWPTPAWQCFVSGTVIKFLIPTLETPWQTAEDLSWKDRLAQKVDSRPQFHYAPNGLTIVKIDVISSSSDSSPTSNGSASRGVRSSSQDGGVGQIKREPSGSSPSHYHHPSGDSNCPTPGATQTLLLLQMAPYRGDTATELLAKTAVEHPFFVKEKGWCSAHPRMTIEKYGIPCQEISVGDVCLPPNHQEAVRTPDLCERFRRFEFDDPHSPLGRSMAPQRLPTSVPSPLSTALGKSMMSPPISPAKKKEKEPDKPKRPMNGFMLFAKKFRLELIQQHPGKDNRAISVLLGEAWKGLPQEERENYSHRAKVMAEEQKKLHPDCWKRKRTVNNSATNNSSSNNSAQLAVSAPAPAVSSSSFSISSLTSSPSHVSQLGQGLKFDMGMGPLRPTAVQAQALGLGLPGSDHLVTASSATATS